jgi:hypothetical protein
MVTQADIDALNAAIALGEREVSIGNKRVVYRSVAELIQARNDLARQLAEASGKSRTTRIRPGHRGYR